MKDIKDPFKLYDLDFVFCIEYMGELMTDFSLSVEGGIEAVFSSDGIPIFFTKGNIAWCMVAIINHFNKGFTKDCMVIPFQSWEDMNERRF